MSDIVKKVYKKNPCKYEGCTRMCGNDFCNQHGHKLNVCKHSYKTNKCNRKCRGDYCYYHKPEAIAHRKQWYLINGYSKKVEPIPIN